MPVGDLLIWDGPALNKSTEIQYYSRTASRYVVDSSRVVGRTFAVRLGRRRRLSASQWFESQIDSIIGCFRIFDRHLNRTKKTPFVFSFLKLHGGPPCFPATSRFLAAASAAAAAKR